MANPIVTVQVTQTVAPTPNKLQKTGAMISSGGTVLTPGTTALLQTSDDLEQYLPAPLALTTVAWANTYGGQVTAATAVPHGVPTGKSFPVTIQGVSPNGYNGSYNAMSSGPSGFTYYKTTDPGVQTVAGTFVGGASGELQSMVNTFFAQGFQQGVYVIELGSGDVASQINILKSFINDSAQMFYSYLVPRAWDADPDFLALIALYQNTTGKTYFFVTTTLGTYQNYTNAMKDVVTMVEAPAYGAWPQENLVSATWAVGTVTAETVTGHGVKPGDWFTILGVVPVGYNGVHQALPGTTGTALLWEQAADPGGAATTPGVLKQSVYSSPGIPATEFTMAAAWWVTLNYSPSSTNKVTPYSYSFLFGVTMFPQQGNGPVMTQLKEASVNIVGFGGEGGISDRILLYGHTMDGLPFNYWYSVDWMQINIDLDLSNAIINGSNDPINPLYYNQDGINRLEGVAANTGSNGIAFGLAIGSVKQVALDPITFVNNINAKAYAGMLVVNAVPFPIYSAQNPGHYKIGEYDGLSMVYTPMRGFEHIIFNIHVTDFVGGPV